MNDKDIFVVESPLGYTVSCTKHQWYTHIIPGHAELTNREADVQSAVEKPYKVVKSKADQERHIYYTYPIEIDGRNRYTKVITGPSQNRYNWHNVITAFDVPKVKADGEELLYDSED